MRNSDSRVIFECESPTLFRSRRVDSLSKLKSMILSHVGGMEPKEVGRVGYRMLASMGNEVFRFRLFWLDGDEYVRLMFDVHGRIMVEQVMELSAEVRDIGGGGSGTSDFVSDDPPLAPRPLHCASPVQDMEVEGEDRTMTTLPIVTEVVHLRVMMKMSSYQRLPLGDHVDTCCQLPNQSRSYHLCPATTTHWTWMRCMRKLRTRTRGRGLQHGW
ncbi:hypothetical protein Ahy_B09g095685 isoform B [Arachis hypogaea]|uniref:Uncharacterized protein n=1 Tax=Arachis hypogaea TaxID=3818 RepID=A0A444XFR8_ARAHY|nr:hypothetical protein Ahy_B09g095685 isoform B [Arachis hypogaea]